MLQPDDVPGGASAPKTVLVVVDDEEDMRFMIRVTLARDPRLVLLGEAASAEEAIELARGLQPGAIVLDHQLGAGLTGLQAAPLIKAAAPNAKILLFTAFDLEREVEAEAAVDAYLRKDSVKYLLAAVDRLLGLDPVG
ncbi:MAG: response regulator [Actinobacteria bacterium]|nr:response regulator [Actinomycetota bacterium]MBV8960381.1 response regulator [Actinomycetota bacterium]MBV9255428.1 response regulator [Actinomycetota bacterium]MBV9664248.1 response regulator [Actinomycetota bacterium]MBV9932821.1 response regulator [Actinomycetota bacterium]